MCDFVHGIHEWNIKSEYSLYLYEIQMKFSTNRI